MKTSGLIAALGVLASVSTAEAAAQKSVHDLGPAE